MNQNSDQSPLKSLPIRSSIESFRHTPLLVFHEPLKLFYCCLCFFLLQCSLRKHPVSWSGATRPFLPTAEPDGVEQLCAAGSPTFNSAAILRQRQGTFKKKGQQYLAVWGASTAREGERRDDVKRKRDKIKTRGKFKHGSESSSISLIIFFI